MNARKCLLLFLCALFVALEAQAAPPIKPMGAILCSVHGTFSNDGNNGFSALSKMIRRRFDVTSLPQCLKEIETYCKQAKETMGVTPNGMKGLYRQDKGSPELTYAVGENCSVVATE